MPKFQPGDRVVDVNSFQQRGHGVVLTVDPKVGMSVPPSYTIRWDKPHPGTGNRDEGEVAERDLRSTTGAGSCSA
jgi:hypothetical protein